MAKLTLQFEGRVLKEYVVGKSVTIGRLPDNTVVIDNPAVSGHHARVFREDDRLVLGRERAEAEAIYETGFGRRAEIGERLAQTAKVRAMEAVAVDHARRNHPYGDSRRAPRNGTKESLSLLRRDLFRVVQEPERTDAVVAQAFIVEEDGRSDEGAGETSSTCLVGAGQKADPEAPVEGE